MMIHNLLLTLRLLCRVLHETPLIIHSKHARAAVKHATIHYIGNHDYLQIVCGCRIIVNLCVHALLQINVGVSSGRPYLLCPQFNLFMQLLL